MSPWVGRAMDRKHTKAAQTRLLKDWGAIRAGTAVVVEKDDGSKVETETASDAWMLSGHTAVILLKGISGAYALDRVSLRRDTHGERTPR